MGKRGMGNGERSKVKRDERSSARPNFVRHGGGRAWQVAGSKFLDSPSRPVL